MLDSLACALVRLISGFCCLLPPAVAVRVGQALGTLASWVSGSRSRVGIRNLRAAFDGQLTPADCRRTIRACYRQLGASFVELLRLPVMDASYLDRYFTIEGSEHLDRALASGRPVILLTGHYGNWELASIAAALRGFPIVALARVQDKLPKLYQLLISYRESKGCTIVHKGGAMRRLITALDRRQLVGIVGDQASRQGVAVDLFGRPALFATGPFDLAYTKHALILPSFIRRVRGPHHQIFVEPPIDLPSDRPRGTAVRQSIEQFAAALSRRILDDPSQWLWMHKRWKHTPARRILVLSDGKLGHLKQSLAVVEAIRARHPSATHHVVEIRYRGPVCRAVALAWSWLMPSGFGATACLQWALRPESAAALLSRYADIIVSAGASTVPANVLWSAAQAAKSIVLMNPAPVPLSRFDLVIAPRHDGLPGRRNVVHTMGAVAAPRSEEATAMARAQLQTHPNFRGQPITTHRQPVVALLFGGDTAQFELTAAFAESLIQQVWAACDAVQGWSLATTSRRTSAEAEQLIRHRLERDPRCRLLLLASRDALDGTMDGLLASADVAVVTGESISMVSEACASGRPVVVIEPPRRRASSGDNKHQRFLQAMAAEQYIRLVPVSGVREAIEQALASPDAAKPLNDFGSVRDAIAAHL